MTGTQPGGPRAAGERIYNDSQRGQQFADVRNASGASNTMASPVSSATVAAATAAVSATTNAANTGSDYWGSYASDRVKKEGK
jgi:hypothetical protein